MSSYVGEERLHGDEAIASLLHMMMLIVLHAAIDVAYQFPFCMAWGYAVQWSRFSFIFGF